MTTEASPYPFLDAAIGKRPLTHEEFEQYVENVGKQSIAEKKDCNLQYRAHQMFWAGMKTQADFDREREKALHDYRNGSFFLERIGRYRSVDAPLTLTLLNLRKEWIREYEVKTAPEYMLLDMALTAYFHFLRLNEDMNNLMANIEWEFFSLEAPKFYVNANGNRLHPEREDKAIAETLAHRVQEVLQPALDQYQRMFIRCLKALRDLKRGNVLLNIAVGQMNIGNKQVNVETAPVNFAWK